jgi:hypothetical protein
MLETNIILGEPTDFSYGDGFVGEFLAFCNTPRRPELNLSYPIGGYFTNMETFLYHPGEPTRFFSLDPAGLEKKDKGRYLVGYTRGYYGTTGDLPKRMEAYAKKHELVFDGPVYNIYLFDVISMMDPGQYLLQVSVPVREMKHTFSHHPRMQLRDEH